jgi:uncharacterized membrane protein YtjA (UPF0391 family)
MLRLALVFLVIALVAALMGLAGVASLSWEAVRMFFFIFLALAVLAFLTGALHRRSWR